MEATDSALPWPKACSLSGGLEASQKPTMTTIEVRVSDRVCQASATMAIEPTFWPTMNLRKNRPVLRTTEM